MLTSQAERYAALKLFQRMKADLFAKIDHDAALAAAYVKARGK
jgi:hypothetical protein